MQRLHKDYILMAHCKLKEIANPEGRIEFDYHYPEFQFQVNPTTTVTGYSPQEVKLLLKELNVYSDNFKNAYQIFLTQKLNLNSSPVC